MTRPQFEVESRPRVAARRGRLGLEGPTVRLSAEDAALAVVVALARQPLPELSAEEAAALDLRDR